MSLAVSLAVFIAAVAMGAVSQVLLKHSAAKQRDSLIREYLNPWVIGAYVLYAVATFVIIIGYRHVPLAAGQVLKCLGYVLVLVMCALILHERLTAKRLVGVGLIILGVMVFALAGGVGGGVA